MSAVDGPGTRVVVFFQGCGINCEWCHSPHSQPSCSPLIFHAQNCAMCMRCNNACAQNVHSFENGRHIVQRENCLQCGKCIEECPNSSVNNASGVLKLPTKKIAVQVLLEQVLPHLALCDGITLSGGEALLQDGALQFLRLCKESGVHTCVETSGLLESSRYVQAMPLVDVWLFGMRVVTDSSLNFHTERLMENALLIRNVTENIIPVIPLVPNVMNRNDVLAQVFLVLDVIKAEEIQLNPWNRSYDVYWTASGIEPVFQKPSDDAIQQCEKDVYSFLLAKGFNVTKRKN